MTEFKPDISLTGSGKSKDVFQAEGSQFTYCGLFGNDEIAVLRKVGPQFGVAIGILQKEGQEYERFGYHNEQTQKATTFRVIVPKGKSYVLISSRNPGLDEFWRAVDAEKTQQPPTNPLLGFNYFPNHSFKIFIVDSW